MCTCAKNTLIHFNFYSYNIFCVLFLYCSSRHHRVTKLCWRGKFSWTFFVVVFLLRRSLSPDMSVFWMLLPCPQWTDWDWILLVAVKKKRAHTYYSKCRSFFSLVFDWFTRPDCKESAFYWLQFMLCIDSNKIKSLSPMCVQCQCTVQPLYSHCNRTMRKCLTEMLNKYQDRARTLARSFARLSALYEITHN